MCRDRRKKGCRPACPTRTALTSVLSQTAAPHRNLLDLSDEMSYAIDRVLLQTRSSSSSGRYRDRRALCRYINEGSRSGHVLYMQK